MKKLTTACIAILLLLPTSSFAGNLIVKVRDAETNLPIPKATVTLIAYSEPKGSWVQDWCGTETGENGIDLRLNLEMWSKYVIKAEAKNYFASFYGMSFYFYGVPEIITISSSNTIVEIFLQPKSEPPKTKDLRTVKK